MEKVEILAFAGLYLMLYAFGVYVAYGFGHYRGIMANVESAVSAARQEAYMEGIEAGQRWENNKNSLNCNPA